MSKDEITKGLVVEEGYAKPGEMVVPGVGPGCLGSITRKRADVGRVVRLEKSIDVIAVETAIMFYGRRVSDDLLAQRVEQEVARIRALYLQVQSLSVGTLVDLPSDQEDPVVEPRS